MKKLAIILCALFGTISFGQMTTAGVAVDTGGCQCYQLTPNAAGVKGAIWSPEPIDMSSNFDMTFNIYLGAEDIYGADGMTFVLQENPNGIGDHGHGLGYESFGGNTNPISAQSLAIEIDTYDSGSTIPSDVPADHIGISTGGVLDHDVFGPEVMDVGNIEDGQYHTFRVQWVEFINKLFVYVDGNLEIDLPFTDIPAVYFGGNTLVHWGFTAATGGSFNEMKVCAYGSSSFTTDLTSVCPDNPIQFTGTGDSDVGFINSWSWDYGDGSPLGTTQSPSFAYTTPGTYTAELTMTDGFGCDYVNTTTITILPDVSLDMDSTSVSCFGDTDGSGTATPLNGTAPFNYSWNSTPVQTSQFATGLAPGTYVVSVEDNLGCLGEDSIVVEEPTELLIVVNATDNFCFGDSTATADVVATDGTPTYTYAWDDHLSQTTSTASNLPAGTYNVTVTDDNGCTKTEMVIVAEGPQIIISGTTTPDNGTGTGTVAMTVSNGLAPYTYSWGNGEITEDLSGLDAGFYEVIVTDDNGCTERFVFEVKSSASIADFVDAGFTIYPNPSNGMFTLDAKGNYEVRITDIGGKLIYTHNHSEISSISLENIESGIYLVTIIQGSNIYLDRLIIR